MKLRGGVGHMYLPQDKIFGELHRCLITSQFLTPPDERFGEITISPTWQNFPHTVEDGFGDFDAYLKALNDRGVYVMANLLNGFNKKYQLPLKALPKNAPGLSSDVVENFSLFRKILEQFVLRYGKVKDDSKIDIADYSIEWNDKPVAPQSKVSGLGLVSAVQILNELNNTWVKPAEEGRLTGAQYAHVLKYLSEGIWSIDPNMAIVAQCTAGWHTNYWQEFFNTWEASYGAFPNFNPETNTGIAISFNQYLLGGCGVWGKCRVKDPHIEIARIGKEANDFLKLKGAYALVTEHGCATEINSDLGYPDYPGLDKYQSQAKFLIDSTHLWLGFSNIVGVTFYQYVDDPNEPRFQYTGLLEHRTLNPKPSYALVKEAFSNPIPPIELPPMPNLQVLTKQLQWSDGQPCNLIHADSPESRLHPNYKAAFSAECKLLPTFGINTITVTMRGDDVTAISPWVNNNPAQGVDTAKLQTWHDQLKEFLTECEKNNLRGVIIAYLGERTNFKSITEAQYQEWINAMTPIFEDISGSIIWGWEEIWDGSESATMIFADRIGGYLKSKLPKSLMMIHNNPGQKPWRGMSNVVQIVCIQETSVDAMKASAQDAFSKGFVPHFHELYPGFKLSNSEATNKALMTQLCNAALSINVKNVGCFSSDYDLQSPDANKLSYLYKHQSALINGTTPPPNPTTMIKYSTQNNHPADAPALTEGLNLQFGAYSIFSDAAGTFDLYKDGARFSPFFPHIENAAPYDMFGTTGTNANMFNFTQGEWKLIFTPKTGATQTINFTVGQTTPPPPTEVKGTGFVKKDGKIEFSFEDESKLTVSPD